MNEPTILIDLWGELDRYLIDACPRFYDMIISDAEIQIHVKGSWSSAEKMLLESDIASVFPNLAGKSIQIIDSDERLKGSDTRRRSLESEIIQKVVELTENSEKDNDRHLCRELVGSVRLRWTVHTKILRFFDIDATSKVIKLRINPEVEHEKALLDGLAKELEVAYGIPVKVMNLSFAEKGRQARKIADSKL